MISSRSNFFQRALLRWPLLINQRVAATAPRGISDVASLMFLRLMADLQEINKEANQVDVTYLSVFLNQEKEASE